MFKLTASLSLLLSISASASNGLIQSNSASNSICGGNIAVTLNGVRPGNAILIAFADSTNVNQSLNPINTITTNNLDSCSTDVFEVGSAFIGLGFSSVSHCFSVVGGNTTVTINSTIPGATCTQAIYAVETSPLSAFDKSSVTPGISTTTVSTGTTPSVTNLNEFVLSSASTVAASSIISGPSAGFIELADPTVHSFSAYTVATAGGTFSNSYTVNTSGNNGACIATYEFTNANYIGGASFTGNTWSF